jgi:cytochrome oxidase Cu insertion factor (SCO1/SenC/PrrC family)
MMRTAAIVVAAVALAPAVAQNPANMSLYQSFPNLVDIDGMPTSLAQFKGNVSLVINVATY